MNLKLQIMNAQDLEMSPLKKMLQAEKHNASVGRQYVPDITATSRLRGFLGMIGENSFYSAGKGGIIPGCGYVGEVSLKNTQYKKCDKPGICMVGGGHGSTQWCMVCGKTER